MLVKEAMNRNPPRIHDTATIKEAAERMALTQASELVVTAGEDAVGVVVAEDLLRCLIPEFDELLEEGGAPDRLHPHRRSTDLLPHLRVKEVMSKTRAVLDPEQSLESAFGLLLEGGGRVLPVVSGGRMVGSLSMVDVARALMWRDRVSPARGQPAVERRKGRQGPGSREGGTGFPEES